MDLYPGHRLSRPDAAAGSLQQVSSSTERFRLLVEATDQIVWFTDALGRMKEDCPSWRAYTGQTVEQVQGFGWQEVIHPEEQEQLQQHVRRAVETRTPFRVNHRVRRHDGAYRHFSIRGVPILDEAGRLREWFGSCSDIHDRVMATAELERAVHSGGLLRKAVVAVHACDDLDAALRCLLERALDISGMDCGATYVIDGDEAILRIDRGLDPAFVANVARRSLDTPYIAAVLERPDEILDVATRFPEQHKASGIHDLRHVYCVALMAGSRPFGFINMASRKTEPPNAVALDLVRVLVLEAGACFSRIVAEHRLQSTFAAMSEGVVLYSRTGAIIDCNPRAEVILGLTRDQIMGRTSLDPLWRAVRADGSPFPEDEHPARVSLRTGKPCRDVTMVLRLPDGAQRWILINAEPVFVANTEAPRSAVSSFTDITHFSKLQERLRQIDRMEGIGHLAGGVAHEFNNILMAMGMSLEMIRGAVTDEGAVEVLGSVENLHRRAAELVKQLLAYSGKSLLRPEVLDLGKLIAHNRSSLSRLLGDQITIDFPDPGPLPLVEVDRGAMDRVLLSLCMNARDAMKQGGTLRIQLEEREVSADEAARRDAARAGKYVCLLVTDGGCGMSGATLARLFEPFFTTKPAGKSTGMDLSAVHGIVAQHHGWITVESALGVGSTFRICLPAAARPPAAEQPPPPRPASSQSKGTILLVDDEPLIRHSLRHYVGIRGYTVLEAEHCAGALTLWNEHRAAIRIVCTDVITSGALNGIELAHRILADVPTMKIIVMSGYNTEMLDLRGIPGNALTFLVKPFAPAVLISAIEKALAAPLG